MDLVPDTGMRTRTSAHLLRCSAVVAVRGPPGPQWTWCRSRDADGDVRAPPRVRRWWVRGPPGPHWTWRRGRDADEDVRAPRRVRRWWVRGPPGPHWTCWRSRDADGDVRAPPRGSAVVGARTSRSALDLLPDTGMRTGTSAHLLGFGGGGCADLPVRIGLGARRPGCGRGRPRTS